MEIKKIFLILKRLAGRAISAFVSLIFGLSTHSVASEVVVAGGNELTAGWGIVTLSFSVVVGLLFMVICLCGVRIIIK